MKKILLYLVAAVFAVSCIDHDFEKPESKKISTLEANMSIADFKTTYKDKDCSEEVILKGTIISSDEQSNFYKEIYIQDNSGVVKISFEGYSLYRMYPVNNELVVKCKGLKYYTQYSAIGMTSLYGNSRIIIPMKDKFLELGAPKVIDPIELTVGEITSEHLGKLVKIKSISFDEGGKDKFSFTKKQRDSGDSEYREKSNPITDDNGDKANIAISSYAPFSQMDLPTGKFDVIGIIAVAIEGEAPSIKIRTLRDLVKK
jgi:hypothetical protein